MREARDHWQQRFDLYKDDEAESRLRRHLFRLSRKGQMREWVVKALLEALEKERRRDGDGLS